MGEVVPGSGSEPGKAVGIAPPEELDPWGREALVESTGAENGIGVRVWQTPRGVARVR